MDTSNARWLALSVLLCVCYVTVTSAAGGTTRNIRDIFMGRCYDYQEFGPGKYLDPQLKSCEDIWDAFLKAWSFKDPSNVTQDDYTKFFNLTRQAHIPENKTLLWSGTYDVAHAYGEGGKRFVTLEDSLSGYLVNGLTWCGLKCHSDQCFGINYETCPDPKNLPTAARNAFWGGASATFASSAKGLVTIMVNGSDPNRPAYRSDSFMALFELADLSKSVTIRVVLVTDLNKRALVTCETGSMATMRTAIQKHGFVYKCEHNPKDVLHLMCVDYLRNPNCLLSADQPNTGAKQQPLHGSTLLFGITVLYFCILKDWTLTLTLT